MFILITTPYENFNTETNGGLPEEGILLFPCRASNGQSEFIIHSAIRTAAQTNKKVALISFENSPQYVMEFISHLYKIDFLTRLGQKNNFTSICFNSNSLQEFLSVLTKLVSDGFTSFFLDGFDSFFDPDDIIELFDTIYETNPSFFALLGFQFNLDENYYRTMKDFNYSDLKIRLDFIEKYTTFSIFSNYLRLIENGIEPKTHLIEFFFRFYEKEKIVDTQPGSFYG